LHPEALKSPLVSHRAYWLKWWE